MNTLKNCIKKARGKERTDVFGNRGQKGRAHPTIVSFLFVCTHTAARFEINFNTNNVLLLRSKKKCEQPSTHKHTDTETNTIEGKERMRGCSHELDAAENRTGGR